ncbi:hypothetical protein V8E54_013060 [Elaphomyces granulatus]
MERDQDVIPDAQLSYFPFGQDLRPPDTSEIERPQQRSKRPHKKSRAGCFSCKVRRVKCQETLPKCENCKSRNLPCVYPSKTGQHITRQRGGHQIVNRSSSDNMFSPLVEPSTSASFTANDLRFFHHFLLFAYPQLPFGSESSWITNVPVFAHHSEYLMHAILSLGASHLSLIAPSGSDYTTAAVVHRGLALRGLNEMLGKHDCSNLDLDAMLAACYALTFQASYMADGLLDFAIMIRGCALVTQRLQEEYSKSSFFPLHEAESRLLSIKDGLPVGPCIEPFALDKSIETLELTRPLLQDDAHHRFYGSVMDTFHVLRYSSQNGYLMFVKIYALWYSMDHKEFLNFISPQNKVSQVLFVHYIALNILMWPILLQANPSKQNHTPRVGLALLQWGEKIYRELPVTLRTYIKWQVDLIAFAKALIMGEADVSAFPAGGRDVSGGEIEDEAVADCTVVEKGGEITRIWIDGSTGDFNM